MFTRGDHTITVPKTLFRDNRTRLAHRLRETAGVPGEGGFVLLQGGEDVPFNDTDINYEFRQVCFPPVFILFLDTLFFIIFLQFMK